MLLLLIFLTGVFIFPKKHQGSPRKGFYLAFYCIFTDVKMHPESQPPKERFFCLFVVGYFQYHSFHQSHLSPIVHELNITLYSTEFFCNYILYINFGSKLGPNFFECFINSRFINDVQEIQGIMESLSVRAQRDFLVDISTPLFYR